ncbi:tetratricopeptide repeat protein [Acinetobacter sp.]|uniref:tetratricopeptide repeat protein n=1 Tax=Acinetobacter sp. TaxID=472 RepID=UPI002FC90D35
MNLVEANEILEQARREQKEGNLDRAIKLLIKINNSSDELQDLYAQAQFKLGYLYNQLDRFAEAEQAYKNVKREDHVESYATAQYNLGYLYNQLDRFAEAEQAYKNVKREDPAELYAIAQLNLGNLYSQLDRFTEAEQTYKNIKREDSLDQYVRAQFKLGYLYNQQDRFKEAEKYYKKVKRDDSKSIYAYAQFNLWALTNNKIYLKHINRSDNDEIYNEAQFQLGELEYYSEIPKLRVILDYWNNILETSEWYPKVVYKRYLINKIFNNKNRMSKKLIEIFKKVDALLNNLVVKRDHENLIAHYTSPSVAKLLIAKEVCGFPINSKMRLNTIDLMNDPT